MENMEPRRGGPLTFSVVTPSLNQGEFIEDAIKSVLSQEGDFYIDYIIMDGGSTDGSVEIIKKYENLLKEGKWPVRCRGIEYSWISEKDRGQADAIEKGFSRAKGDIGVWLNSDDIFYSASVFATVAKYFIEDDIDLLIGDGITVDRQGRQLGVYHTDRINLKELIFLDYHILQNSAFLKMQYYRDNPFNKNFNYSFDVDFFIRLIASGIRYKKVPDKLSCFRIYPETKSVSGQWKRVKEVMAIERQYTDNKMLLFVSWIYKYLSIVFHIRYGDSILVRKAFFSIRNLFYWLILGTWGRK